MKSAVHNSKQPICTTVFTANTAKLSTSVLPANAIQSPLLQDTILSTSAEIDALIATIDKGLLPSPRKDTASVKITAITTTTSSTLSASSLKWSVLPSDDIIVPDIEIISASQPTATLSQSPVMHTGTSPADHRMSRPIDSILITPLCNILEVEQNTQTDIIDKSDIAIQVSASDSAASEFDPFLSNIQLPPALYEAAVCTGVIDNIDTFSQKVIAEIDDKINQTPALIAYQVFQKSPVSGRNLAWIMAYAIAYQELQYRKQSKDKRDQTVIAPIGQCVDNNLCFPQPHDRLSSNAHIDDSFISRDIASCSVLTSTSANSVYLPPLITAACKGSGRGIPNFASLEAQRIANRIYEYQFKHGTFGTPAIQPAMDTDIPVSFSNEHDWDIFAIGSDICHTDNQFYTVLGSKNPMDIEYPEQIFRTSRSVSNSVFVGTASQSAFTASEIGSFTMLSDAPGSASTTLDSLNDISLNTVIDILPSQYSTSSVSSELFSTISTSSYVAAYTDSTVDASMSMYAIGQSYSEFEPSCSTVAHLQPIQSIDSQYIETQQSIVSVSDSVDAIQQLQQIQCTLAVKRQKRRIYMQQYRKKVKNNHGLPLSPDLESQTHSQKSSDTDEDEHF